MCEKCERTLLLDGCHRACGLYLSRKPVKVLVKVLVVPKSQRGSVFDL